MSDLDLTEAAKAVLEAIIVCGCSTSRQAGVATQAVIAAAPLIERQVRERIAAKLYWRSAGTNSGIWAEAVRIARGES